MTALSQKVLVIIAVQNEAPGLANLLPRIPQHMGDQQYDVLVVDNFSTDKSVEVATGHGALVIELPRPKGTPVNGLTKGVALRAGFSYAMEHGYDSVITMDGDGQHDPSDLAAHLGALRNGYEVVFSSRYHPDAKIQTLPPSDRILLNVSFGGLLTMLTGMHLTDPACGFWSLTRPLLERLSLTTEGYGIGLELAFRVSQLGDVRWTEVPITMIYRGDGKLGHLYTPAYLENRLVRFQRHAGVLLGIVEELEFGPEDLLARLHAWYRLLEGNPGIKNGAA